MQMGLLVRCGTQQQLVVVVVVLLLLVVAATAVDHQLQSPGMLRALAVHRSVGDAACPRPTSQHHKHTNCHKPHALKSESRGSGLDACAQHIQKHGATPGIMQQLVSSEF
jgi:hypothetical protein